MTVHDRALASAEAVLFDMLAEVMAPAGLFVLGDSNLPIVGFAGGSGITPVFSIIKSAVRFE